MKPSAWVRLSLLPVILVSQLCAQLAGPAPGPNVGDFVELPMLVSPSALVLLPGDTQALLCDQGRLKILDLSTGRVRPTPVFGLSAVRIALEGSGPTALV